jgi:hypothetical protein
MGKRAEAATHWGLAADWQRRPAQSHVRQNAGAAQDLEDEFGVRLIPFRSTEVDLELPLWLDQVSQKFSPSRVSNKPADPW